MKIYKIDYTPLVGTHRLTVPTDSSFLVGLGKNESFPDISLEDSTGTSIPAFQTIGDYTCFRFDTDENPSRKEYTAKYSKTEQDGETTIEKKGDIWSYFPTENDRISFGIAYGDWDTANPPQTIELTKFSHSDPNSEEPGTPIDGKVTLTLDDSYTEDEVIHTTYAFGQASIGGYELPEVIQLHVYATRSYDCSAIMSDGTSQDCEMDGVDVTVETIITPTYKTVFAKPLKIGVHAKDLGYSFVDLVSEE